MSSESRFRTLVESEQRYRALLEGSPDSVFRFDRSGRALDVHLSPRGRALLGEAQSRTIVGQSIDERWPAHEAERLRAAIARALASGEPEIVDVQVTSVLGAAALEVRIMRCAENEVIAVFRDVTELRKLRERLRISEHFASLGTLAAGVAHEINNPLTYVIANLALARSAVQELAEFPDRPRTEALLERITSSLRDAEHGSDRVQRIVRDLRSFSRANEERGPVNLRDVLESALGIVNHELQHRAKITRDFRAVTPVLANEGRLCQVFMNLLVNAAHAIAEGKPGENEVRVATREIPGFGVVEITDTGSGIAKEHLPRIFDPFFTTKDVGQGSGLGLSICRGILENVGGEITVESEVGSGSTFTVKVPLGTAQAHRAPVASAPVERSLHRAKVLFVDDEASIVDAARRLLSREHDVVTMQRAADALARIAGGERFDAIFCDLMMPEMTGMDLYDELVRSFPEQAARLIFLSGGAFTPSARAFIERPEIELIEKPFSAAALLLAIEKSRAKS